MPAPSIRYINQSAPFWDFIASMEEGEHPLAPPSGPWQGPWGGRRGRHGHGGQGWHHGHDLPHRGPPQAGEATGPSGASADEAAPAYEQSPATAKDDTDMEKNNDENVADPPEDTPKEPGEGGCAGRRRHCGPGARRCGGRENNERPHCGRGGPRGFGGPHGHHHPHGHGPRGPGGPHGGPWGGFAPGFRMLSNLFQPQQEASAENTNGDWAPEADVFDTQSAYVVHISLPGANKDDVGVTWDPERSELQVAGVVHRPGDEEFLKTLALDERRVGAFERKVRLGTRAHPAHVDVDGISAKFENGILIIEVPKMLGEFVDVKKVDIE